jgi:YesN/AraC family two-component response regulator
MVSFKAAHYDVTIIDVRMPGMNGFELYAEVKSIDYTIKSISGGFSRFA